MLKFSNKLDLSKIDGKLNIQSEVIYNNNNNILSSFTVFLHYPSLEGKRLT